MTAVGWSALTAVASAVAAMLLLAGDRSPVARWASARRTPMAQAVQGPGAGTSRPASSRLLALGCGAGVLVVAGLPAAWVVPSAIVVGALTGGGLLRRRRGERRERVEVQRRVLDLCEHLAGDLGAGQPPGVALARAGREWPLLAPVAEAFRVGADVPAALRTVSRVPGAEDLRLLAAAWQVAHRTGQGLAAAVDRVGGQLVEARSTRRVVQGELASARATARLVAALPVVALAMGSGVGGDPLAFLVTEPVGWACLAGGLAAGLAGLAWIEAIARDVDART